MKSKHRIGVLLWACHAALALVVSAPIVGCAGKADRSKTPTVRAEDVRTLTAEQRQKNVESFDVVWETVRDKHFDPKLNGVDWEAVRVELRPKVEAATTMNEARAAMEDALHRLKQSHFGILPSDVYDKVESDEPTTGPSKGGSGTMGVEVAVIDGRAVVKGVTPESPADVAGVRCGWIVSAIDGDEVAPTLARIAERFGKDSTAGILTQRAAMRLIQRPVGATAEVKFLNAEDATISHKIKFVERTQRMAGFGNLPKMPLELTSEKLGDVGYVRLSLWMDPSYVVPGIRKAVDEFKTARGIILDLRGNPGGIAGMAMGVGNFFVPAGSHKLGTMINREGTINFVLNRQPTAYAGPLAILVDEGSASTSEIFAGGMKDIGRARIFGTRTPGLALPSIVVKLPNGDGFQYVIANYVSTGGKPLEANGVVPDETVALDRASLLRGHDPVIDAAVAWIERQSPATSPSATQPTASR